MALETTDELLAEISDHWAKAPDSNLYKLMDVMNAPLERLSDHAQRVADWHDIDMAEGNTLDLIGEDKNVPRIDDDDTFYRWLLKLKAMISMNDSTIESIEHIVKSAFKTNDITVITTEGANNVQIELPISVLPDDLTKRSILMDYIRALPAAGFVMKMVFAAPSTEDIQIQIGQTVQTTTTANADLGQEIPRNN